MKAFSFLCLRFNYCLLVLLIAVNIAKSQTVQKSIKVNIYGGSYPAGTGWNNWNIAVSPTFSNLLYADGAISGIQATLNLSNTIADNGSGYPVTMCPVEVGRTASYSTVTRSLILSGLNNGKKYNIEVYGTRTNNGNSTKYTVSSSVVTINTHNNYSNKALFSNISPVNGQLIVKIERVNTWTYINGFILTEVDGVALPNQSPVAIAGETHAITLPASSVTLNGSSSYDVDGFITGFNWVKLSGPTAVITTNNTAITTVTGLTQGNYIFQLNVSDNLGATGSSTVQVTVNQIYIPPAGTDSLNCGKVFKIVVLGSSTAAGGGANPFDSAWVNKFNAYVKSKNTQSQVVNLGYAGYNTYHVLNPTGFTPQSGRPSPDNERNITKAMSLNPDVIIINLPSNDNANSYTIQEQKDNYERAMTLANAAGIPVFVSTTQPRNNLSASQMNNQIAIRDWTYQRFGEKAIDFWTTLANADGTIKSIYNADGIHLNNAGHHILYSRVVAEKILDTLCLRKNNRPIANAGNNQNIFLPIDSVMLNGSSSVDPDGSIISYQWSKILGPIL